MCIHNAKDGQTHTHQSFFWSTASIGIASLLSPAEGQTLIVLLPILAPEEGDAVLGSNVRDD